MNIDIMDSFDLSNGGIFVIMVGPPGSGKTITAEKLVEEYGFIRICPDDIRQEITGDSTNQSRNDEVFAKVYSKLEQDLKNGYNVVYDATNCRTAYRLKILDIVSSFTDFIICLCATTPISVCLENNKNRIEGYVPEDVIERMYFTLRKHPPTIFEGYDLIVGF